MQKRFHTLLAPENRGGNLRPAAGASVTVTDPNGALATIYSDNGVTEAANPLTSSATGYYEYYAADGRYTETIVKAGRDTVTISDILLEDPADSPSPTTADIASTADSKGAGLVGFSALAEYAAGTVGKWLVDLKAAAGSALVGFIQSGTGAVERTVQDKLREIPSAADFGAVGVAAINAAIAATTDGVLRIPAGTYAINGDILIQSKGDANTGGFKLDATGVVLTGSGNIIIDSCKRVTIEGLDAPNHDLVWRGCWWGEFNGMRFRNLVMGDAAGTSFSSVSWCSINGGQSQSVILHASAASFYNEVAWDGHSMRGSADQGFSSTAAYAFEFNGNVNAQAWKFNGGDISYHTSAVYTIGAGNTGGDIELAFDGVYFDSVLPAPTTRNDTRILTAHCHHANGTAYVASMSAALTGPVELYREDRSMRHDASTAVNLIPNGDFGNRLTTWVGANLPVGGANSSTITAADGGLSGTYLNINQALTTSNSVRFRSKALPYAGRVTATIVMRNADAGSKAMVFNVGGLAPPVTISDTEWTLVRLTYARSLAAGATQDVQIYTTDGTAFNVDVAYVSLTMGEGAALLIPSSNFRTIEYSTTHDFASIANGAQATVDFTVTGAAMGDFVLVSSSGAVNSMQMTAHVVATNTVRIFMQNNSGAAVDPGNATYYVRVWKRSYS